MAFSIELGLILLFSILGGVLAVRLRQPSVIGLILVGAIVGPYNLGLIKDTSLINASIEIGAILLLFTVGIEFSLQRLLNLGLRVFFVAATKLGIVFLASYYTSFLLGFGVVASIYLGVILSITSTVIVIKILDQKGMAKREELPLLIAVLIIEDIFGVFALTFFSGLNTQVDLKPFNLFARLLLSLLIMLIAYVVLQRIMKPIVKWLVKYSTEDTITFTSIGLCGGMSYLAFLLSLSPSVGAFLAGNIVASLPNSRVFEKAIHPFILTFTSLFFFSIGTIVNFSVIAGSFYVILALFIVSVLFKFFAIGFSSYTFANFSGKSAVFSGIAMVSVGEFSLLIAKEASSLGLKIDLVSITASIIFLSSIVMSVLINNNERIYNFGLRLMPSKVLEHMKLSSEYINSISWGMFRDKVGWRRIILEWKAILNSMFLLFAVFAAGFFLWHYFTNVILDLAGNRAIMAALIIFAALVVFFPALRLFRNTYEIIRDFLRFFVRLYPKEISSEKRIFRSLVLLCMLFILVIVLPAILAFFKLGIIYNLAVLFMFIIFIVYLFRSSNLIHHLTKSHKKNFDRISEKYRLVMKKKLKIVKNGDSEI